ncbi:MAG: plasmid pRiA4b ORF-3 family protein [Actinomycetota bacterium]|nr:plasmid pRiA4b ORF-3 family protein [Actinomycetota bacterium]
MAAGPGLEPDLDEVHEALYTAFSWGGHHLCEFSSGRRSGRQAERFHSERALEEYDDLTLDPQVRLDHVLTQPGDKLHYTDEFGDHGTTCSCSSSHFAGEATTRPVVSSTAAAPPSRRLRKPATQLLQTIRDSTDPQHELLAVVRRVRHRGRVRDFGPATFDRDSADEAVRWALGRPRRDSREVSSRPLR